MISTAGVFANAIINAPDTPNIPLTRAIQTSLRSGDNLSFVTSN
jgi:hypothetical protein